MLHYNVFIILVIVANALTNPITNSPARCCFPKRYSYKTGSDHRQTLPDGTISVIHTKSNFAYDAERGFVATRGTMKSEKDIAERSFWSIYDIKNGDYYSIDVTKNSCVKDTNSPQQERCIRETAIYANSSIDVYDGKTTLVDTWITQNNNHISYQKVRGDDCLPLESGFSMPSQGITSSSTNFDILEDIADPTIFQIPSSCH